MMTSFCDGTRRPGFLLIITDVMWRCKGNTFLPSFHLQMGDAMAEKQKNEL